MKVLIGILICFNVLYSLSLDEIKEICAHGKEKCTQLYDKVVENSHNINGDMYLISAVRCHTYNECKYLFGINAGGRYLTSARKWLTSYYADKNNSENIKYIKMITLLKSFDECLKYNNLDRCSAVLDYIEFLDKRDNFINTLYISYLNIMSTQGIKNNILNRYKRMGITYDNKKLKKDLWLSNTFKENIDIHSIINKSIPFSR